MDGLLELSAQLLVIMVAVHCDSMLDGCLDQFVFAIRGNGDGAVSLAWNLTAIDEFA